jgi:putative FmdB family regulatory protein
MPTYEYACTSCGRHIEAHQSFSDPPLTVCEVCGGKLKRVYHPVGILLKGSGFYSTDNRSGRSRTATKEPEKTETKSDSDSSKTPKPSSGGTESSGSSEKSS